MTSLRTPEQVAADLQHITAYEIRQLVRKREVEYVRAARGKVLFTDSQVEALIEHMTQKPGAARGTAGKPDVFGGTGRSKSLHRNHG